MSLYKKIKKKLLKRITSILTEIKKEKNYKNFKREWNTYSPEKKAALLTMSQWLNNPDPYAKINDGITYDDRRKPIPDKVKMFVWQRDRGKCVKCGSPENLEFDHIIPVSKGGSDTERNIQLLCEKCNRVKKDNVV